MQKITPCLWFDANAEEAARFYVTLLDNSRITGLSRYGKAAAESSGQPEGSAMVVMFELAGLGLMGLNGGPHFSHTPAASLFIYCTSAGEVEGLWTKLSDGGSVLMPLDTYPFAEKYGWIKDRFGVSWQIILAANAQKVAPCLLFVNERCGQAEAAMEFYMSQFEHSRHVAISRYGADGPGKEGTIAYANFTLAGQEIAVMDGPGEHTFTFTPAFSLMVNCESQQEIDTYWSNLAAGGREDQCGWLQDKFGVSWQVVPSLIGQVMQSDDAEAVNRVMASVIQMKKLDLARLREAFGAS